MKTCFFLVSIIINFNDYFQTAIISLDNCDTAVSLAGGLQLGSHWSCANVTYHSLPERCELLTETCHR